MLVIVLLCITLCPFYLDEEKRAVNFALIVFLVFCDYYCYCSMTLPHCDMCWSTVCDCGMI